MSIVAGSCNSSSFLSVGNDLIFEPSGQELKVNLSQKEILMPSILQKNELESVNFCPSLLGQQFFVGFLGELKKPKSPF